MKVKVKMKVEFASVSVSSSTYIKVWYDPNNKLKNMGAKASPTPLDQASIRREGESLLASGRL